MRIKTDTRKPSAARTALRMAMVSIVGVVALTCIQACRTVQESPVAADHALGLDADSSLLKAELSAAAAERQPATNASKAELQLATNASKAGPPAVAMLRAGVRVKVTVIVAGRPEIDDASETVSESGAITLPLIRTVPVADLTLTACADRLTEAYSKYYVDPFVVVEFSEDQDPAAVSLWGYVTVLGRVKKPGQVGIPSTLDLTVSQAIARAGGFDTSAKERDIRISRRGENGEVIRRNVNMDAIASDGRFEDDFVVQPGDVIFVPESVF